MNEKLRQIEGVRAQGPSSLELRWSDGETAVVDLAPLLRSAHSGHLRIKALQDCKPR